MGSLFAGESSESKLHSKILALSLCAALLTLAVGCSKQETIVGEWLGLDTSTNPNAVVCVLNVDGTGTAAEDGWVQNLEWSERADDSAKFDVFLPSGERAAIELVGSDTIVLYDRDWEFLESEADKSEWITVTLTKK